MPIRHGAAGGRGRFEAAVSGFPEPAVRASIPAAGRQGVSGAGSPSQVVAGVCKVTEVLFQCGLPFHPRVRRGSWTKHAEQPHQGGRRSGCKNHPRTRTHGLVPMSWLCGLRSGTSPLRAFSSSPLNFEYLIQAWERRED